jgi:hypothetical protein
MIQEYKNLLSDKSSGGDKGKLKREQFINK